ncbi:phosphoribosyltransferase [Bradyrhizobium sp. STM 3561]|uniref:phosphoribosyltransferase n=1 Tax=Bradyrhizobium sp. STM 3561 TaxID=578923 RepID=UPI00388FA183
MLLPVTTPLVRFPHLRPPWVGGETVYVCGRYGHLNGTELEGGHAKARKTFYQKAKFACDYESADRIVEAMLSDRVLDRLIDDLTPYMANGVPLICAVPHPPFDDAQGDGADLVGRRKVRNALPLQYMARLSVELGADMDQEIVQKGRVSRTKLKHFPRFLWQPCFDGAVRQDAAYILVDDVLTTGGTLAALRSHIIRNGGKVAAVTTLAHGLGEWRPLALLAATWHELQAHFGVDFNAFWRKEIGHDATCLTEAEGHILLKWRTGEPGPWDTPLQRLRDRLAAAAAKNE